MVEYSKANVKSWDKLPKQLKTDVDEKTGETLRMSLKTLDGNYLSHELLLTTRQEKRI